MKNIIPELKTMPAATASADIEFFDPPMCCPTGLCGPTLDQTLLNVNEMVSALQSEGVRVERYQMSSNPNAFLGNAEVMQLIRDKQLEILPITVVRGRIIKISTYPTVEEIQAALNKANQ